MTGERVRIKRLLKYFRLRQGVGQILDGTGRIIDKSDKFA